MENHHSRKAHSATKTGSAVRVSDRQRGKEATSRGVPMLTVAQRTSHKKKGEEISRKKKKRKGKEMGDEEIERENILKITAAAHLEMRRKVLHGGSNKEDSEDDPVSDDDKKDSVVDQNGGNNNSSDSEDDSSTSSDEPEVLGVTKESDDGHSGYLNTTGDVDSVIARKYSKKDGDDIKEQVADDDNLIYQEASEGNMISGGESDESGQTAMVSHP